MQFTEEFVDRFWGHVTKGAPTECWNWHKSGKRGGYGQVKWRKKSLLSHRVAWELTIGPIPKGMMVCHHCDNPLCCNSVAHCFLGTAKDNLQDMVNKGRSIRGALNWRAKLTDDAVTQIRQDYFHRRVGVAELMARFNMTRSAMMYVLSGRAWKHVPMPKGAARRYTGKASLTDEEATEVWRLLQARHYHGQIIELARQFGVNRITIRRVRDGTRYAHITRPGPTSESKV